jgi:hypothetical protein
MTRRRTYARASTLSRRVIPDKVLAFVGRRKLAEVMVETLDFVARQCIQCPSLPYWIVDGVKRMLEFGRIPGHGVCHSFFRQLTSPSG